MRACLSLALMVAGGIFAQISSVSAHQVKKPFVLFMVIGGSPKDQGPPKPVEIHSSLYFETKKECDDVGGQLYKDAEVIRGYWCVEAFVTGMH